MCPFYPFCVKSTFFSGRMERMWLRTWSGLVWEVRVTLYCGWNETGTLRPRCAERRIHQVPLCTLILRGPSRRPRLLLGVSMLIILSRPLSREPKTLPPRFFFPLSPVEAMSRDRDLRKYVGTLNPRFKWSHHLQRDKIVRWRCAVVGFAADNSPSLWTEGQNSNIGNLLILYCSLLIVVFRCTVYTYKTSKTCGCLHVFVLYKKRLNINPTWLL